MAMQAKDADVGGRRVGSYVLFEVVGKGALGTVHLGWSHERGIVAIKRFGAAAARNSEFVEALRDDGHCTAWLREPTVAAVRDLITTEQGELCLVTDYFPGESLANLLRAARAASQPVSASIAVAITIGLLRALEAVHRARSGLGVPLGLVHGDVRPENVIVGVDGMVHLVDLGLARATQLLLRDQMDGRVAYLAPEQVRGREIDERTDVYAASSILWEMLSGQRPFEGESPELLATLVLGGARARKSDGRPIPRAIGQVLERGLTRHASSRFSSAGEMALALENVASPATAEQVSAWIGRMTDSAIWSRADAVVRIKRSMAAAPPPSEPTLDLDIAPLSSLISASLPPSALFTPTGETPLVEVPECRASVPSLPGGIAFSVVEEDEVEASRSRAGSRVRSIFVSAAILAASFALVGSTGTAIAIYGGSEGSPAASVAAGASITTPVPATSCDRARVLGGGAWECLKDAWRARMGSTGSQSGAAPDHSAVTDRAGEQE